jgi:CRP/FNR family cyclic AMP-dependent transcriptional regulator
MSESVDVSALQQSPFLAGVSAEDVEGMLAVGTQVSFDGDQVVFEAGDMGDAMYVIAEGEARVDVGGRFHILKAGNFFGEMALIAPGKRLATVRTVTPVVAVRIPAEGFQAFLLDRPAVALAILKALVIRLREVEQRIDAWMA